MAAPADPEMLKLLDLYSGGQVIPPVSGDALPPDTGEVQAVVGGAYDAASRFDRSVALWTPSMRSADDDIIPSKGMMDARTRDSVRNDAYSAAGAEIRKDNIVGSMFLLNSKPETKLLGLDSVWEEEFQAEVEAKFTLWAESFNNWPDASRINNFTGLVRLAVGMIGLSGEILATAEWIPDGRPFATAIQMVDPDRLETPTYMFESPRIRGGVEKDARGAPIAYHIRTAHPYDFSAGNAAYQWKRVPVRKRWGRMQVIHIYEQFRPEQSRGVSKMVAALKESRIAKQFRDVVLQNAVVNATYAATIESDMPQEAVYAALGGGQTDPLAVAKAMQAFAGGYLSVIGEYMDASTNLQIDGVKIPYLMPGTKLQLRPASQNGALGTEFEQSLLRYIAAALGVSYEQLSKDYSSTNYSSARAAMNETYKAMQASKRATADRFATHVYMLWLEEAISKGEITTIGRGAPNFWEGLNREAYGACDWIGASRGQIDELKETQAAVLRLKYNLSTSEDELARLGKDWRKVYRQIAREKAIQEELGITPAVDGAANMMNAASGDTRESTADAATNGDNTNA